MEVLTGLIKANITSRMALQVPSQVDSRTILDMAGAEKLLGNGDMLYLSGDSSKPRRLQGVYILEREIKRVVDYIADKNPLPRDSGISEQPVLSPHGTSPEGKENNLSPDLDSIGDDFGEENSSDEELLEAAGEVIFQAKKASASLLQRRLRVGYARAARILDILEERGLISPGDGAKPREVYLDKFNHGESR